jgi:integrase
MTGRKKGNRRLPPGLYAWSAKDGKTYWKIGITVEGSRKWLQLGAMSKEDALVAYRERMVDPDVERSPSRSLQNSVGWSEYASTVYLPYIRDHRAPKTLEIETHAAGWLALFFKDTNITAIDTEMVEAYKRWRRENGGRHGKNGPKVKPRARTINLELACMNKALKYAVTLGIIDKAPTIIRYPEARERREPRWVSAPQMDAIIDGATPARRLLMLFAFHTGMRPGEVETRIKADIDLERGFCRVGHRGEFRVKRERQRTVPLSPALRAELERTWDRLPGEGPIFVGQCMKSTLKRICEKVGIEPALNPYGTRHSFVSRWAAEDRSRDALIKIVGHTDGQMIDRIYAHFGKGELADHIARLGWGQKADVIPIRASASGRSS